MPRSPARRSPACSPPTPIQRLDPATQQHLGDAVATIRGYLASPMAGPPLAGQLAPDLRQALAPRAGATPLPAQAPAPAAPAPAGSPAPGGGGGTGRVGEVARATLRAIDFPQFVAALIQGAFQAIVDGSIQQMAAYARCCKEVAETVDELHATRTSPRGARGDYLAERYAGVLSRESGTAGQEVDGQPTATGTGCRSFFTDLGFAGPEDLSDGTVEDVVVPAARSLAEQRQQTLATMVLMGINRVVVNDGEITAKLMFHVDASETTEVRFDQTKTTTGTMSRPRARARSGAGHPRQHQQRERAERHQRSRRPHGSGDGAVPQRDVPARAVCRPYAIQLINSDDQAPSSTTTRPTGRRTGRLGGGRGRHAGSAGGAVRTCGAGGRQGPGREPWAPGVDRCRDRARRHPDCAGGRPAEDGPVVVTEVELDVPMEVVLAVRDGVLVVHAAPGRPASTAVSCRSCTGPNYGRAAAGGDGWWPT